MTPQEERNKRFDEKLEAGEFDYYEDGKFCGVLKEPLKYHITSEVHLAIEQVERWAEEARLPRIKGIGNIEWDDENKKARIVDEIIDDLLSFLTTLKK